MSHPYGKFARSGGKGPEAPQPVEIQVNITDRYTIEQLALEVQRALAMVQDYGAIGLEKFRFRLLPLDHDGAPMVLRDEQGRAVTVINIPDVPAVPVYRQNEPGVGIVPANRPADTTTPTAAPRNVLARDR